MDEGYLGTGEIKRRASPTSSLTCLKMGEDIVGVEYRAGTGAVFAAWKLSSREGLVGRSPGFGGGNRPWPLGEKVVATMGRKRIA